MADGVKSYITPEQQKALKTVEDGFIEISELQDILGIQSYQYARTMVEEDRYGLGTNAVTHCGKRLINKQAALEAGKAVKAAREQRAANKAAKAEGKSSGKGKSKKKAAPDEPAESLDDLVS